jgi:CRP-like cAMP-binding protein
MPHMIAVMSDTVAAFVLSRQDAAHQLEPGQSLFREGDPVRRAYVVLEGEMKLVRYGASGTELILHRVGSDTLSVSMFLAEASCFSDRYHCTAVAISECRLASVGRSVLFSDDAAAPFLFSHRARPVA